MDLQAKCPKCKYEFSLSEEFQKDIEQKWEKLSEEKAEKARKHYEETLQKEKVNLWKIAQEKADEKIKSEYDTQLKNLENQNAENKKKLENAQQKELEFLKKERELEEKSKNIELELEKKLQQQLKEEREKQAEQMEKQISEEKLRIEENIKKEFSDDYRLKIAEKDKQMEQMKKSLEEAQRRAEQGSMQIQGDVKENDLRDMLQKEFIADIIEDVPTGIRGADIIQTVRNNLGQKSGVIIWESKNTKSWTEGWLQKLKDDQANIGADIAILVSKTLPEGVEQYELRNGVWVVGYKFALSLITLLRFHVLEIGTVKTSLEGKDEKMNMLYEYLSSPQFKNKIENIVDAFSSMKADLDAEKRSFQKHWSKREKQLERVMMNTSGFYGDLQGIAGNSLPKVTALELPSDIEEGELF